MYLLYFYVPIPAKEEVKEAIFQAGAGKIGSYEKCSFEYKGKGQFLPGEGSNPTIGGHGKLERVDEVKVEMVCSEEYLSAAFEALKKAHPYEEPAYGAIGIRV